MIVTERYAVCAGCGRRQLADAYPADWLQVLEHGTRTAYCSRDCMLGRPRLPIGMLPSHVPVLRALALGHSNKEIAHELGLALSTVKNRLRAVNTALGTYDRLQAVLVAHARGVIDLAALAEATDTEPV